MGGYDGLTNQFLSSCEKYDLINDNWSQISNMNGSKCSFACIVINNFKELKLKYIYFWWI